MLDFINVSFSVNGKAILRDVNLHLDQGTIHVILGSSGSGKTTLLRIIAGLIAPTGGRFALKGDSRQIGYVIQEGGLFPHMSARDNVALVPKKLQNWSKARIDSRIAELANVAHIENEILDRFPRELSGGQRQRVSLMRALVLDPPLLLLDEPLGALDPIVRSKLRQELRSIFRELKKTVVMVTHDLGEAAYFADSVTLMADGRIEQHGVLSDLVQNPASKFVEEFVTAQIPSEGLRRV